MPDSRIHSSSPAAATAGRQSRAHAWYEAYGQTVYSYVRFHVSSADEADDVTAETFLKVLAAEGGDWDRLGHMHRVGML